MFSNSIIAALLVSGANAFAVGYSFYFNSFFLNYGVES